MSEGEGGPSLRPAETSETYRFFDEKQRAESAAGNIGIRVSWLKVKQSGVSYQNRLS